MRRISIGISAVVLVFSAVQLSAQSAKPVSLGIAAGAAIPVGDFSDSFNTGYNGTVSLGFSSIGTPLGLRVEGMYNKFLGRNDNTIFNQPDSRIIGGTANLVYA